MRIITTDGDVIDVKLAEEGLVLAVTDSVSGDQVRVPLATADVVALARALTNQHAHWRNAKLCPPVEVPPPPADDRPIDFAAFRRALEVGTESMRATR